jgi:hypothetical protein
MGVFLPPLVSPSNASASQRGALLQAPPDASRVLVHWIPVVPGSSSHFVSCAGVSDVHFSLGVHIWNRHVCVCSMHTGASGSLFFMFLLFFGHFFAFLLLLN